MRVKANMVCLPNIEYFLSPSPLITRFPITRTFQKPKNLAIGGAPVLLFLEHVFSSILQN